MSATTTQPTSMCCLSPLSTSPLPFSHLPLSPLLCSTRPSVCSASKLPKSSSSESLHSAVLAADSLAPPKGKARRRTMEDDSLATADDDAVSTTSTSSSASFDPSPLPPLLSPSSSRLHDILEALPEKRSSIRMAALTQLVDLLESVYTWEQVKKQVETLTMYALNCIKRGETKEVELACHALALIAITSPEGDDTVHRLAAPTLKEYCKNKAHSWAARSAAVQSLTFIAFLLSPHPDETMELMTALLALLSASPNAGVTSSGGDVLDVAVFDSWGLLACALPDHVLSAYLVSLMPRFTAYLHSDSVDVRMSVGEDVAMLFSVYHQENADTGDGEEEEDEPTDPAPVLLSPTDHHHAQPRPTPTKPASSYSVLSSSLRHDLLPLLQTLSTDSNRHRARKERKEQRASFRDILDSVETGEEPTMRVEVKKQKLDVVGWREIKVWVAVRQVVGKGVGVHVAENPLVQGLVGWEVEGEAEGQADGLDEKSRKAQARAESRVKAKEVYQYNNKQRAKKRAQVMGED